LTITELKNEIAGKYSVGQEITLWIREGERSEPSPVKVKILGFYPNHVLIERKGFKEGYSFFDLLRLSVKPAKKPVVIPKKLTRVAASLV
jgi:hypothetical protein